MCMNLDQHLPAITVIVEMAKVGFTGQRIIDKGNLVEPNNKLKRKKKLFPIS